MHRSGRNSTSCQGRINWDGGGWHFACTVHLSAEQVSLSLFCASKRMKLEGCKKSKRKSNILPENKCPALLWQRASCQNGASAECHHWRAADISDAVIGRGRAEANEMLPPAPRVEGDSRFPAWGLGRRGGEAASGECLKRHCGICALEANRSAGRAERVRQVCFPRRRLQVRREQDEAQSLSQRSHFIKPEEMPVLKWKEQQDDLQLFLTQICKCLSNDHTELGKV